MNGLKHWTRGVAFLTATAILMIGCNHKKGSQINAKLREASAQAQDAAGHDHADEGPHGGALAEWGEEEYHAEFMVDHAKKQVTVYILDKEAKMAVPIQDESITLTLTNLRPPVQIALGAHPQEGDPQGSSSRFAGTHEKLATKMELKGEISGKVDNRPYTGTFEVKAPDRAPKPK